MSLDIISIEAAIYRYLDTEITNDVIEDILYLHHLGESITKLNVNDPILLKGRKVAKLEEDPAQPTLLSNDKSLYFPTDEPNQSPEKNSMMSPLQNPSLRMAILESVMSPGSNSPMYTMPASLHFSPIPDFSPQYNEGNTNDDNIHRLRNKVIIEGYDGTDIRADKLFKEDIKMESRYKDNIINEEDNTFLFRNKDGIVNKSCNDSTSEIKDNLRVECKDSLLKNDDILTNTFPLNLHGHSKENGNIYGNQFINDSINTNNMNHDEIQELCDSTETKQRLNVELNIAPICDSYIGYDDLEKCCGDESTTSDGSAVTNDSIMKNDANMNNCPNSDLLKSIIHEDCDNVNDNHVNPSGLFISYNSIPFDPFIHNNNSNTTSVPAKSTYPSEKNQFLSQNDINEIGEYRIDSVNYNRTKYLLTSHEHIDDIKDIISVDSGQIYADVLQNSFTNNNINDDVIRQNHINYMNIDTTNIDNNKNIFDNKINNKDNINHRHQDSPSCSKSIYLQNLSRSSYSSSDIDDIQYEMGNETQSNSITDSYFF